MADKFARAFVGNLSFALVCTRLVSFPPVSTHKAAVGFWFLGPRFSNVGFGLILPDLGGFSPLRVVFWNRLIILTGFSTIYLEQP
jgi:hypothetical protein